RARRGRSRRAGGVEEAGGGLRSRCGGRGGQREGPRDGVERIPFGTTDGTAGGAERGIGAGVVPGGGAERGEGRLLAQRIGELRVLHRRSLPAAPRFSRIRSMPSRTRVFTVPSGSPSLAAISLWLSPSKYASSRVRRWSAGSPVSAFRTTWRR